MKVITLTLGKKARVIPDPKEFHAFLSHECSHGKNAAQPCTPPCCVLCVRLLHLDLHFSPEPALRVHNHIQ